MERIRIIGVGKAFGIRQVFSGVSFELKSGDRLGLVGPNGAGKSTLLKCILGLEEYDDGQVILSEGASIGYLQQEISLGEASLEEEIRKAWEDVRQLEGRITELTERMAAGEVSDQDLDRLARLQERMEWLGGYDYEQQSRRIAFGLGFSEDDLKKPASAFSGGQKTRINLAKALVRRPDFLFLDEPTNHLDVDMLEWLENYLSAYGGGILLVSHDRYFLDRVATGMVELENGRAVVYKGNYSRYAAQKAERQKAELAAYTKQQEHIRETEAYIDKYRAGIKSKMARGRQSQLNRLERLEAPQTLQTLKFTFPQAGICADKVLVMNKVNAGYGDAPVFQELSLMIRRGEAVALIGPNGAGKSTLVKAITGELDISAGTIDIGNRVQIGYFSQDHEELHPQWQVLDEIMLNFNYPEEKARNVLGMFLFRGDDVYKPVQDLSGGERARLALLKIFLEGDNFLILDEPTNHLDIPTREIVEQALLEFGGTYFVISHDRYFLDKVSKRTLSLEEGKLTDYLGNYSYFREKVKEQAELEALAQEERLKRSRNGSISGSNKKTDSGSSREAARSNAGDDKRESENGSANEAAGDAANGLANKQDGEAVNKPANGSANSESSPKQPKPNAYMQEKQLAQVETDIARLEATMKMYETQLADPSLQDEPERYEELARQIAKAKEELETNYAKWEQLAE